MHIESSLVGHNLAVEDVQQTQQILSVLIVQYATMHYKLLQIVIGFVAAL